MARLDHQGAAAWLATPEAVRSRCAAVLAAAEGGDLAHFAVDQSRLAQVADYVAGTIRDRYPDLDIPYHSRWRHFAAGGVDRWQRLAVTLGDAGRDAVARLRIDLVVVSVLLDAGAGDRWHYHEQGGDCVLARSEGLAVASLHLFTTGLLSADLEDPLRADAAALEAFTAADLALAFHVSERNPLPGLEGRAALLRRLGGALRNDPEIFGAVRPRVGNLYDYLVLRAEDGVLPARDILLALLRGLGPIWPGRITLGGVNLGDVWHHPAVRADDPSDRLVPFHKLSQWLAYSLVEPLQDAGLAVAGLDALTGLAEYRNGGLFLDLEVLRPKHDGVLHGRHDVGSEVVVEWRALTVALLDRLQAPVAERLGLEPSDFPLARLLEGGTWSAGRRIAAERRPGGGPPIAVISDGTVF